MESEANKTITIIEKREKKNIEWLIQLDNLYEQLKKKLTFPFEAEVYLYNYSEVLSTGDIVKVINVDDYLEMEGIMMKIKKGRKVYYIPLDELIVLDKKSENYKIVEAYKNGLDDL